MKTYFIQEWTGKGPIKIGRSKDPERRLKELQTSQSVPHVILGILDGDREAELHHRFKKLHLHGEWFKPGINLLAFLQLNFGRSKPPARVSPSTKVWLMPRRLRSGECTYHARWIDPHGMRWKSIKLGSDRNTATERLQELRSRLNSEDGQLALMWRQSHEFDLETV